MAEQSIQDLEQAAKYRPGAVSQIANLLTGGLYGMASGTTAKNVEAQRARQALFQENLQNRLMQRRRMEQLLEGAQQAGISSEEAGTLINDPTQLYNRINEMRMRESLAKETGRQMGVSGDQGPIQTQTPQESRAFGIGMAEGQADQFNKNLQLSRLKQSAQSLGIQISDQDTEESIRAKIGQQSAEASQKTSDELARKRKADEANAGLRLLGIEVPKDDQDAIALWNQKQDEAPTRAQQGAQRNLDKFWSAVKSEDENQIRETYSALSPSLQNNADIMSAGGINPRIPAEVRKEIPVIMRQYEEAGIAARAIADLVGSNDYRTVSSDSFNELTYKLNKQKDKFFKSNAERDAVNRVITAFSTLVSSGRKNLFGASLTSSELAEAQDIWAKKDSADFLPRALMFIDRVHSKARIKEMSETYSGVPQKAVENEAKYLSRYDKTVSKIKGFRRMVEPSESESDVPAAGGTNAPAAGKTTSGKGFKIISE
jgi:hypothetical protein